MAADILLTSVAIGPSSPPGCPPASVFGPGWPGRMTAVRIGSGLRVIDPAKHDIYALADYPATERALAQANNLTMPSGQDNR
jgi:hypothetical protein